VLPLVDVYQLSPWNAVHSSCLASQAQELVRHSKSTFWLDTGFVENQGENLCVLEKFAWRVFQQHTRHYNVHDGCAGRDDTNHTKEDAAIDLHYDKDETVAEVFDLGFFPTLSTVSYLGSSDQQCLGTAPTIVFKQQYEDPPEAGIREMLISHPSPGKHLVFDGRMLHGAPAHPGLRQSIVDPTFPKERITFLVNIWIGYRPCDATTLPNDIREKLNGVPTSCSFMNEPFVFVPDRNIATFDVCSNEGAKRIQLPFVGGESTWADPEDHDGEELVVSIVLPPKDMLEVSTALLRFEGDNEAFIC
jgi:hypothetical protein